MRAVHAPAWLAADLAWPNLAALLHEERQWGRLALWLPVLFGGGILLSFAAERDPSIPAAAAIALLFTLAALMARHRPLAGPVLAAWAALGSGFLVASWRVEAVRAPILDRTVQAQVTGVVERIEVRTRGYRLWLAVEAFDARARVTPPDRLRATFSRRAGMPAVGDRIVMDGEWRPPPGPVRPGGYDWAREAYFSGLGAVGTAQGEPRVLGAAGAGAGLGWWHTLIEHVRAAVAARIRSVLPGDTGAIGAALVVGERGAISAAANEAMRISGLAHILSISGLHMVMFAGAVFAACRALCALMPGVALRYPVKTWAAIAGLAGGYIYVELAGEQVAAQRAFLMTALAFIAVIVGRFAVTSRSVAIAAFLLLSVMPEMLLTASFQMSFAAVMALVAAYEIWRDNRESEERGGSRLFRAGWSYVAGLSMTTLVAGCATSIFAAYHFQRIGLYALLSNLLAVPVTGILVMPFAVLGLVLTPLGLDAPCWHVMGLGIDIMIRIAEWVSALPGADRRVAAFGPAALGCLVFALVWASLWRTCLRYLSVLPAMLGIALASSPERADIHIEPEGRAVAVRHPDGRLRVAGMRFARFAAGNWLAADGDGRLLSDRSVTADVSCDSKACVLTGPDGRPVVLAWTYEALRTDCSRAALVITRLAAPPGCRTHATVIDAHDLAQMGAISLRLTAGEYIVEGARLARADRPWFNRPTPGTPDFAPAAGEPLEDIANDDEPDIDEVSGVADQ